MGEIRLREVLSNVSRTLFDPEEIITADLKIEIAIKKDPRNYYLIFNYPYQIFKGARRSNEGKMINNTKVDVETLGEVGIYVDGELKEFWKCFPEFWEKYGSE